MIFKDNQKKIINNKLSQLKEIESKLENFSYSSENINDVLELKKQLKNLLIFNKKYNEYKKNFIKFNDLKMFINNETDKELLEWSKNEIIEVEKILLKKYNDVLNILEPKEKEINSTILEIRGAVGGEEANIFAYDLFKMYSQYLIKKKFKFEVLEYKESSKGGIILASLLIKGKNIFNLMKNESGAHRVQRVPKTENNGRVHTSIATVAVLKVVDDSNDINIKSSDLRIDTFRASGAGGQHVNKTDSAVRITYLPENIVVSCQSGRSQHDNKDKALKLLKSKLLKLNEEKHQLQIDQERKEKVGYGFRSEKIRTYNYQQNRITDHRIKKSWQNLNIIMTGELEEIFQLLKKNKNNDII